MAPSLLPARSAGAPPRRAPQQTCHATRRPPATGRRTASQATQIELQRGATCGDPRAAARPWHVAEADDCKHGIRDLTATELQLHAAAALCYTGEHCGLDTTLVRPRRRPKDVLKRTSCHTCELAT